MFTRSNTLAYMKRIWFDPFISVSILLSMPRKADPVRDFFRDHPKGAYKTARVKCSFCGQDMSATPKIMNNHLSGCKAMSRPLGRLLVDESLQHDEVDHATSTSNSIIAQFKAKVFPSYNRAERSLLDKHFAMAMHETGTAFSLFDHAAWRRFFDVLGVPWSPPSTAELSATLLTDCYRESMTEMTSKLTKAEAITLGVDGATNVLSRSMSNVIAHDPRPWFVEYLRADLKRETAPEVTAKIQGVIERLERMLHKPLVHAFISDSCNLMRAVREQLEAECSVAFAYGCSAHALNNFCQDIVKLPDMKTFVGTAVFLSKTVKNTGLLNKIYSDLCLEILKKPYAMVLYSASRWSSINYMFTRLSKVKRPISAVITTLMNERDERGIDGGFELPTGYADVVMDPRFWKNVKWSVEMFDPICKCIGILESNAATMATAYAAFVFVYVHVQKSLCGKEQKGLLERLLYRWKRIRSSVHALAFYCDPFYRSFRVDIALQHGAKATNLGDVDICTQCRDAIRVPCRLEQQSAAVTDKATSEFMRYCVAEDKLVKEWAGIVSSHPQMIWSQAQNEFPTLSSILMKVYASPASTAGVERQHKVAKRIHSPTRNRLGAAKVEEQSAIAHNAVVAQIVLPADRQPFEKRMVAMMTVAASNGTALVEPQAPEADTNDDIDLTQDELAEQEALACAMSQLSVPWHLPDELLFPYSDE